MSSPFRFVFSVQICLLCSDLSSPLRFVLSVQICLLRCPSVPIMPSVSILHLYFVFSCKAWSTRHPGGNQVDDLPPVVHAPRKIAGRRKANIFMPNGVFKRDVLRIHPSDREQVTGTKERFAKTS